jgi:hypothetical protein
MSCERCGSERLFQFEASPSVKVAAAPLPLVCRQCGQITIGGQVVPLPEAMEKQAMEMAEAAELAGKDTREELEQDKDLRIEKYFENVYRRAYLDGFFRCLAFYQHQAKEGRLVRLRELWEAGDDCWRVESHPGKGRLMSPEAYTEFEQLLTLSAIPEKPNAKDPANTHSTNQEGAPLVHRQTRPAR